MIESILFIQRCDATKLFDTNSFYRYTYYSLVITASDITNNAKQLQKDCQVFQLPTQELQKQNWNR